MDITNCSTNGKRFTCPNGKVLAGAAIYNGSFIDGIKGLYCADPVAVYDKRDGTMTYHEILGAGSTSGILKDVQCPVGSAVSEIDWTNKPRSGGTSVGGIRLTCRQPSGSVAATYEFGDMTTGNNGATMGSKNPICGSSDYVTDLGYCPGGWIDGLARQCKDTSWISNSRDLKKKVACCLGRVTGTPSGNPTTLGGNDTCPGLKAQGSSCDAAIIDFCKLNPSDPICTCVTSPAKTNPACVDASCIRSGYATANMRAQPCPSIIDCSTQLELSKVGRDVNASMAIQQNCGNTSAAGAIPPVAPPTTVPITSQGAYNWNQQSQGSIISPQTPAMSPRAIFIIVIIAVILVLLLTDDDDNDERRYRRPYPYY